MNGKLCLSAELNKIICDFRLQALNFKRLSVLKKFKELEKGLKRDSNPVLDSL